VSEFLLIVIVLTRKQPGQSSSAPSLKQWRKLNLKAQVESTISQLHFQAPSSRRFQRGFDRVKLHRPTLKLMRRPSSAMVYRRKLNLKP